jgi:DNA-binding beta-propeller fold protein YncE
VANNVDNTISIYSLNSTDGSLTQLATSPFAISTATAVFNVVVDPSGSHLYVLDAGIATGQVFGYSLNSDGSVGTAVSGSPQPVGALPTGIAIDATGVLIAVDNGGDGTISLIPAGANGAIGTPAPSTVAAGAAAQYVTFYNAP